MNWLLNGLLVVCVIAGAAGWFLRRSDPRKYSFLVLVPAVLVIGIVLFKILRPSETAENASALKQAEQWARAELKFDYAAGWQLAQEAARRNPNGEALALVTDLALKQPNGTEGQWLMGIQQAAKKAGLKLTVVPLGPSEFIRRASFMMFFGEEIKVETLNRIQQEHPNATVWISYGVPQTSALVGIPFLGADKVRVYCYVRALAAYGLSRSWWTAQLQSGRLQALALDRPHGPNTPGGGKPTDDPEANSKMAYVLLTTDSPELPAELVEQLPQALRN